MGKSGWKKIIDLALYLLFCALAGTGLLLAYRLPHGSGAGQIVFLGYRRHDWGEIHTWLAYATIIMVTAHFLLNWQWLVKVAASKHLWRLGAGILTGMVIVGIFLLVPTEKSTQNRGRNASELLIDR